MPEKNPPKYFCYSCDYITSRNSEYERHIKSKQHISNKTKAKSAENPPKYICISCNYYTNYIKDYNRHIETKKHISNISATLISEKSPHKYTCNNCNYYTSDIKDYNKHIHTKKHIRNTTMTKEYICENCNKHYIDRTGLWRHKQKCLNTTNINNEEAGELKLIKYMFLEFVKQNTEFKDFILEQNKQNNNLQSQFIELAKEKAISNCNNNNNNNNTHFNLQFFLNETCKDAMNISEFIEQVNVSLTDLENTGRLGYAEGITRIFIKGLKELDINQRPIHCSDAKRETLYIKEGGVWEKDDVNKTKLTNAIKRVAHKNIRKISDWINVNPNCKDSDSIKNDLYLKIVSNSMSGSTDEEADDNYNKIKKNIIKQVIIEK
jgi:hypothetical protein